jgi:predicted Fe-S protein YdhL (DUF1289 family)
MQAASPLPIKTPCVKICVIDDKSGLCRGCLRTLGEIARWSTMTPDQRDQVMDQLDGRRSLIAPGEAGG